MIRQVIILKQPEGETPAGFKKALGQAMEGSIEYWHDRYLPGHFEMGAHKKYGYATRSPQYLDFRGAFVRGQVKDWFDYLKQTYKKMNNHKYSPVSRFFLNAAPTPDLIFSSQSKTMAKMMIKTTGTGKQASGTMTLPWHFGKKVRGVDKGTEVTAVTPEETTDLIEKTDNNLQINIDSSPVKTTTVY